MQRLVPLSYHRRVRDLVRSQEPALWDWYSSDKYGDAYVESVRLELLKSTYRMAPERHGALYKAGELAFAVLGLNVPLVFYQAQEGQQLNACLCFVPGEVHIVLQGPVQATLSAAELAALLGHELAHYVLWMEEDGAYRRTSEIVEAMAGHPAAEASHVNTALRFRRYTEIYADRGGALVSGDVLCAIACLVKVQTGLTDVDAGAYLQQAEEVLAKAVGASEEATHPETFIRARAVWLWAEEPSESESKREGAIAKMVQELRSLEDLDLLEQVEMSTLTHAVVQTVLNPEWIRTDRVMAHARLFFPESEGTGMSLHVSEVIAPSSDSISIARGVANFADAIKDYFAYVLLDFAVVDPELGEVALGHALQVAHEIGCAPQLEKAARKELKMTKKAVSALHTKLRDMLQHAASQPGSST